MNRAKEIKNALNDIKDLIKQHSNYSFHEMKHNILDLTEIVEEEINHNTQHNITHHHDDHLKNEVKQMIKPYLKSWLDENLPAIVQKIVDRQIQLIIDKSIR